MGTLIIKNVDLDKLEEQRLAIVALHSTILDMDIFTEESDWDEPLNSIINMLDEWSDLRNIVSLGSIENQKAKDRQMDIDWSNHSVVMVYQCPVCGYQGGHDNCPECNVAMEQVENVK